MTIQDSELPAALRTSIIFERPRRLVAPSAFAPHIPFAFWIIAIHRPAILVELGTRSGNSYCAFLQAIEHLRLQTRAFGVGGGRDSGEESCAESTLQAFANYHDEHYAAFSRLLRSRFDDAARHFNDGTIDLLHIDGLHSYDAAQQAFRTWLPKMSKSGVMVLHDVNVREGDFGVWKLWEEVSARYPSF